MKLKYVEGILMAIIISVILIYSKSISNSIKSGINICLNILIPSMFVFLIISDFCQKTGILNLILKPFGLLCEKLFKLDSSLGPILIFSLICGYPSGIHLISRLVKENKIDRKTATRMSYFCVNSGPAFLIGAISFPIFNSIIPGIVLFISQIAAFFTVGTLCSIGKKLNKQKIFIKNQEKIPAFITSVQNAIKSMTIICGFTLFFSGIIGLLIQLDIFNITNHKYLISIVSGLIEVTNGVTFCKQISGIKMFFILSLITSFGGVCVHCQLRAIALKAKISFKKFYFWRILYCAISVIVSCYIFYKVKMPMEVFSHSEFARNISTQNPLSSLSLIILSVALLCCDKKIDIIIGKLKSLKRKADLK